MIPDATELARKIREGEIDARDVTVDAIAAIREVDQRLHAVVHWMDEAALTSARQASGPFAGVPIVVKDLDGFVSGVPYTGSSQFLKDFVPKSDSVVIARLRAAGFVFVAKTKCPELGILGTTEPAWRGPSHNPWNLEHSPGGSSGGSAALVAAGAVPVGHGGDGGGSLRIPASACGLVGLKPSRGRVPVEGGEGWGGFVQQGIMTRSVRDTASILDLLSGPSLGDPYAAPPLRRPLLQEVGADPGRLRIGFSEKSLYGHETDASVKATLRQAVETLSALGHDVFESEPPIDRALLARAYLVQVAAGTASAIRDFERRLGRTSTPSDWEQVTWFLNQLGSALSALELQEARDACHRAAMVTATWHADVDLFLTPTLAHPPVRLGELALKAHERAGMAVLRVVPSRRVMLATLDALAADSLEKTPNTQLFNQTGQPAISLPCGESAAGLPIGVQFAAAYGREDLLIRVASQWELAAPWMGRRPSVFATKPPGN